MYNYIDFEFNFNFNKAMKEKVSGDRGASVSARVPQIFMTGLYTLPKELRSLLKPILCYYFLNLEYVTWSP